MVARYSGGHCIQGEGEVGGGFTVITIKQA